MKSFNLGLKLLAGKNTVSPTSTANCIHAKIFVNIPLTKLLALYSSFVNIMFTQYDCHVVLLLLDVDTSFYTPHNSSPHSLMTTLL